MREIISLGLRENKTEKSPELNPEIDPAFTKESFWARRFPQRLKEKIVAGMMVGMTLLGPMGAKTEAADSIEPSTEASDALKPDAAGRIPMAQKIEETGSSRRFEWGGHVLFFVKGADGNYHFNPWSMLFPAQLEFEKVTTKAEKSIFQLPYEYSRLFDTGAPLRSEDHQKIVDYIQQKMAQEFADSMHGLHGKVNETEYKDHHEFGVNKPKIKSIRITGFASPEGPRSKGPSTVEQGNIDLENIGLALKRAETAMGLTEEGLAKLGISMEQLEEAAKKIDGNELQPSDGEMAELAALASGEAGVDPVEKIWNLIKKYNDGEITDPNVIVKLDEIIGSKRKVEITIEYENDEKSVHIFGIPAPWLFFWVFRRRGQEPTPTPEPTLEPPVLPKEPLQLTGVVIPPKIREVPLPDPDSPDYQEMEERALIDDLYVHFRHPATIRRGLDYQAMADNLYTQYDEFPSDTDREEFLAAKILQGWKDHDRQARRDAGVSDEELDRGLDYENQDSQIRWAKMHAKGLFRLVQLKRELASRGEKPDYLGPIASEYVRLLKRRNGEGPEGVKVEPEEVAVQSESTPTVEPEKSEVEVKEDKKAKWLEALREKSDTLAAFFAMVSERAMLKLEELDEAALAKYHQLKENWLKKKEASLQAAEELSTEDQNKLAGITRISDIGLEIQKESSGSDIAETAKGKSETAPGVSTEHITESTDETEKPDSALTLADVEDRISRLEKSSPVPLLALEARKAKRAEFQERQEAEANPDKTAPQGFLARVRKAFTFANAIAGNQETVEARMSPLGLRKEAMESLQPQFEEESGQPKPESTQSKQESMPEKPSVWSWKFWKERGKGLLTFGLYDIHQAEKFRSKTGEVAGETEALSTLLREEKNLGLEEAQTEAQEIIKILKKEKITNISAVDYERASSGITDRKRKENDDEIAYIIRTAENAIYDNLRKQKGEAGQEVLTRENLLAIRQNLTEELNKLRDGALKEDRVGFAKLVRQNLDSNWKWRYVWGGMEALAGIWGTWFLVTKFSAIEAAKAVAGSPEAAKEFVTQTMNENVWNTLKKMAQNGPQHFTPTDQQLVEWGKAVVETNHWYEPEWLRGVVDGLRSTRTLPQGIPMQVPLWIAKAMGFPG